MRLRFCRTGSFIRVNTSEITRNNIRQMARNVKAIHTTLYILGKIESVASKFILHNPEP